MNKAIEEFAQKLAAALGKELEAAHHDAFLYGVGFISVDRDMNMKRLSYKETLRHAEFIDKHAMPHKHGQDDAG